MKPCSLLIFVIVLITLQFIEIHSKNIDNSLSNYEKYKLSKKCKNSNDSLCKELNSFISRTKYRVEAVLEESARKNNTKTSSDLFNLAFPLNNCKAEECDFCCLSNNRCGQKKQCENSKLVTIINSQ